MKKIYAIYILFILLIPIRSVDQISELIDLSEVISAQSLEVEKWTVTVKEQLSVKEANDTITKFADGYTMKHLEDKQTVKYIINKKEETDNVSVSFTVVIPREIKYNAELIMTIEGEELTNQHIKAYNRKIQYFSGKFFSPQAKVFTCLTAINNDIIISDVFLNKISKKLELKHVSTQVEHMKDDLKKETIYGYTTFWNNKVLLADRPLNFQMVIQSGENQQQKIIIGTPILITEY